MNEENCTNCDRRLNPADAVWLELNAHTGVYSSSGNVPVDQSQGWFAFGKTCAKRELNKNAAQETKMKITMFRTINDSENYGLALDGLFQYFETEAQAKSLMNELIPETIDESLFGSAWIITPALGREPHAGADVLSNYAQTDLREYGEKRAAETKEFVRSALENAPHYNWSDMFGIDELPSDNT